jgi:hypothetical protein
MKVAKMGLWVVQNAHFALKLPAEFRAFEQKTNGLRVHIAISPFLLTF